MRQFHIAAVALSEHCGPESNNPEHARLVDRLGAAAIHLAAAARLGCDFDCLPESFARDCTEHIDKARAVENLLTIVE